MGTFLSLIIPAFNAETTIKRCIESILMLDYKNLEIIVVNDGSTDNTKEIIEEMEARDSRIHCYTQNNRGVSIARNKGLELANGDFIMFVDADDYLVSDCFQYIETNADQQLIVFPFYIHNDNKKDYCITDIKNVISEIIYPTLGEYHSYCFNSPWSKVYSRKIIFENNIFFIDKLKMGEDTLFNLMYLKCINNIKCINKVVYKYDANMSSVTRKFNLSYLKNDLNFQYSLAEYISKNNDKYLELARLKASINGIWRCFSQYWTNAENKISIKDTYSELKKTSKCDIYFVNYEDYRNDLRKAFPFYKNMLFECIYKERALKEIAIICRIIRIMRRMTLQCKIRGERNG